MVDTEQTDIQSTIEVLTSELHTDHSQKRQVQATTSSWAKLKAEPRLNSIWAPTRGGEKQPLPPEGSSRLQQEWQQFPGPHRGHQIKLECYFHGDINRLNSPGEPLSSILWNHSRTLLSPPLRMLLKFRCKKIADVYYCMKPFAGC